MQQTERAIDEADIDRRNVMLSRREATAVYESMAMLQAFLARASTNRASYPYTFADAERVKRAIAGVFGRGVIER